MDTPVSLRARALRELLLHRVRNAKTAAKCED